MDELMATYRKDYLALLKGKLNPGRKATGVKKSGVDKLPAQLQEIIG